MGVRIEKEYISEKQIKKLITNLSLLFKVNKTFKMSQKMFWQFFYFLAHCQFYLVTFDAHKNFNQNRILGSKCYCLKL